MLKKNTKYTALEILKAAGFDQVVIPGNEDQPAQTYTTEEIFGKFSVNIGGISGIVDPSKVILVSPGTEKLVVVAAGTAKEVELSEGETEQTISEGARVSLDEDGKSRQDAEVSEKVDVRVE